MQAALGAQQKLLDLSKAQRDAEDTTGMNAIRSANRADHRRSSADPTAAQEYAQRFQQEGKTIQDRVEIINKEFEIKEKIAQAEMTVLKARLNVLAREQAAAKGMSMDEYHEKDEDGLIAAIADLTSAETAITASIEAQRIAAISNLREEAAALLDRVKQE